MPAAPVHHPSVDKDGSWDGPEAEKDFDGTTQAAYDDLFAWVKDSDTLAKSDGWGPHHDVADGKGSKANLKGVEAAMAALNGGRSGDSSIPEEDRAGVHAHLAAHYKDAGVDEADIPELKSASPDTVPAKAIRGDYHKVTETRISTGPKFELREIPNGTGGTNLRFTGFASVTEAEYEMEDWLGPWVESITAGAFKKTLDEGCDTAFLLNHQGMTLARTKPGTLKLAEETDGTRSPVYGVTGLHSEALLDPTNFYVQAMRSAVERGDLDEMSFAFRVMRQEWNSDWDRRWINEVSLDKGDVSLVNYGANPHTGGTVSMRQRLQTRREPLDVRRLCIRMIELRSGKTISAVTMSALQEVLDLIDASDTNVDEALVKLSDLMGVTNPDVEQDDELDRGCGCCAACSDDCDGSCCDDCDMGGDGSETEQLSTSPFGILPDSTRRARAELEALRHPPRRTA